MVLLGDLRQRLVEQSLGFAEMGAVTCRLPEQESSLSSALDIEALLVLLVAPASGREGPSCRELGFTETLVCSKCNRCAIKNAA